jgi:hypothetical protein
MRAKLLIDVMEVIPERLGTDLQLAHDGRWALTFGKVLEHSMLLLRQPGCRLRSHGIVSGREELLRRPQHASHERFRSLPITNAAHQVHDPAASDLRIFVDHGRDIHPNPPAGSSLDLEIEVGDRPVVRRTIAHLTPFGAHECAKHAAPLKQLKAGLADDLVAAKPEQHLGAGVPLVDFAGVADRECRISSMFEEVEELAI